MMVANSPVEKGMATAVTRRANNATPINGGKRQSSMLMGGALPPVIWVAKAQKPICIAAAMRANEIATLVQADVTTPPAVEAPASTTAKK
jgi:hypothetical protein